MRPRLLVRQAGIRAVEWLRRSATRLPHFWKRSGLIAFDVVALTVALWLSFSLRYALWQPPATAYQFLVLITGPLVAIPIFIRMGLYRAVIRYLPDRALWTIVKAMTFAAVGWLVLAFGAQLAIRGFLPRSVPIFYWLFGIVFIAGSRFAAKAVLGAAGNMKRNERSVVIYGAGDSGAQVAMALARQRSTFIAGFLDDDRHLQGRDVVGIRVFPASHLGELVKHYGTSEVILSMPSLSLVRRQQIVAQTGRLGLKIRTLPPLADVADGKYQVGDIREIDIDELLGRSSVPPDPDLLRQMIAGRSIMVTGAGGSIGGELCRLIARSAPARLVMFEANEFALYQIHRELADMAELSIVPVLGTVGDAGSVRRAIAAYGVEAIFHAAAYKHVPMVEANALEGIRNNVVGTAVLAATARACGVGCLVLISSDKAVHPASVMGATKRWAELIVLNEALRARAAGAEQRFCSVRFGNVLGSNGSVVPLFREQISRGGPVTLTDARMTRYFMSIHEAAELIVQAGALSRSGDLFVLEMGEPVPIKTLVENMIRLAGRTVRDEHNPDGDIAIAVVGNRPGEKLHEELFYDPSRVEPTVHRKILRAELDETQAARVVEALPRLRQAVDAGDEGAALNLLFDVVGEAPQHQADFIAAAETMASHVVSHPEA
jgi:FlaA1/EpsC-like NDP-sugar epimerase